MLHRTRAALIAFVALITNPPSVVRACCCPGHCDVTKCAGSGECGSWICPNGQTLPSGKCPRNGAPGSTCNSIGCNCDAGAKKFCTTPTPVPTPAPTAAPTAVPTAAPTASPTMLCDFDHANLTSQCLFDLSNITECAQVTTTLVTAMKCIQSTSCIDWRRACSCAGDRADNASCAFDCGSTPKCAKKKKPLKSQLPIILGSLGGILVVGGSLFVCYRQHYE